MSITKTKPKQETYTALKNLCTIGGKQVKKGKPFKCYKEEADDLRSKGAV